MMTLRRELEQLETRDTPATFVWSGAAGTDNWMTDGNWVGNLRPTGTLAALDDLVFPSGASRFTTSNDFTNAVFNSITFQGDNYAVSGNALSLVGSSAVTVNTGLNASIGLGVSFAAASGVDQFFTVNANSTLTVNGVLSGNGGSRLAKNGIGTLVLTADNATFNGRITSNAGVLRMQGHPNALGSTANDTFIAANSQLQIVSLSGATFEAIHLNGNGISNDGALLNVSGNTTTNGSVFLDTTSAVGVSAGMLVFNNTLVASGNSGLTKAGPGTLQLSQNATLFGATTVAAGTLIVGGNISGSPLTMTGGVIGGTGILGTVNATGGTVQPGVVAPPTSPTNFRSSSVTLNGATYAPRFVNNSSGDVSDLLNVTGNVNLTGATLAPITAGFTPSRLFSLLLVANDGADPVVGTFAGLAEGAILDVAGTPFRITYAGNDGNDVLLVPQTPIPTTEPFAVSGPANGLGTSFPPTSTGKYQTQPSAVFSPFGSIAANVRVAMADVDGDQIQDTILVTGPGVPIRVAVSSGLDASTLVAPFDPFGGNFTGGGFVAAAQLDGDGRAEFFITPDQGGGPRVTIFTLLANGTVQTKANFFGIDDEAFRGGARPAVGDVDDDGIPDLLVAAGFGGGPRVALFDGDTLLTTRTKLVPDFFAFPEDANTLRNGVFAALGDLNGDGFADLAFGGGPGGGPRVYVLSGQLLMSGSANLFTQPLANFFVAGNSDDRGGVRLAMKDADDDAKLDLIVGSGEKSPAKVRIYLGKNFTSSSEPAVFQDIAVFGGGLLTDGVFVG